MDRSSTPPATDWGWTQESKVSRISSSCCSLSGYMHPIRDRVGCSHTHTRGTVRLPCPRRPSSRCITDASLPAEVQQMHHSWHSSAPWNDRGHMAMHTSATVLLTEPPPLAHSRSLQAVSTLSLTMSIVMSYPADSCSRARPIIPSARAAAPVFLSSPAPSTSLQSRSQRIPPVSLPAHPSFFAHDSNTPVEPTSVAMGLKTRPPPRCRVV